MLARPILQIHGDLTVDSTKQISVSGEGSVIASATFSFKDPAGDTFDTMDDKKPRRTRWSGLDETTAWTPSPKTQSDLQDLENGYGEVKALVGYADDTIIFQEKAIVRAEYVGTLLVFDIRVAEPNQGTVGGNTVIACGNRVGYRVGPPPGVIDGSGSGARGF